MDETSGPNEAGPSCPGLRAQLATASALPGRDVARRAAQHEPEDTNVPRAVSQVPTSAQHHPSTANSAAVKTPSSSSAVNIESQAGRSMGKRPLVGDAASTPPESRRPDSDDHHHPERPQSVTPPKAKLPSVVDRRRARDMASALLRLTRCAECEGPLSEPVTLPCGHSACLQCIRNRCHPPNTLSSAADTEEEPTLPCTTHIPPRLPLSPMTVSCPVSGCPRSVIGRGMGKWSGHRPRYGLVPSYMERLPSESEDLGPGSPPLDGFVIGVADHPHRLTVVGPQCRTKAHLFAVPPVGVETTAPGCNAAAAMASLLPSLSTSNLLRPDVSLSKAIAILKRYAAAPVPRSSRARKSPPRSLLRSRTGRTGRRRNAAGLGRDIVFERRALAAARGRELTMMPGASGSGGARGGTIASRAFQQRSASSGGDLTGRTGSRRGRLSRTVMGVLGTHESELESGTVGGVRAVSESEEDGDDDDDDDDLNGQDDGAWDDAELSRYDSLYGNADNEDEEAHDEEDVDGGYHAKFRSGLEDEGEEDPGILWPDGVGGAYARPLAPTSPTTAQTQRKRRRGRPSLRPNEDLERSPESVLDALRHGPTRRLYDDDDGGGQADLGWTTEESALDDSLGGRLADSATASASRSVSRPSTAGGAAIALQRHESLMADTNDKRSLALSTKTGLSGEPLVQTVATLHAELLDVLECQLCYLLLYQPLTTPCGHTFCRSCFARSLDHGNRCPLCRSELPNVAFFAEHPCNSALLKILAADTATLTDEDDSGGDTTSPAAARDDGQLDAKAMPSSSLSSLAQPGGLAASAGQQQQNHQQTRASSLTPSDGENNPHHLGFKRLYDNRKVAIEQEEREARLSTPLFICTLAFPQMPTILHIFEPRYRLMIRRCLESGSPRFGMVMPSRTNGGLDEYGTMLEIKSVQMLTDGRSMLETVGSYRFKVLEKGTLDGYTVGRIERVEDISLGEEAELEHAAMVRRQVLERQALERRANEPRSLDNFSGGTPRSRDASEPHAVGAGAATDNGTTAGETRHPVDHGAGGHQASRPPAAAGPNDDGHPMALYRRNGSETAAVHGEQSSARMQGGSENGFADDGSEAGLPLFLPMPQEPSIAELVEICRSFIATLRSGSAPWLLTRLNNAYGPMPEAHEVERLGYWMALVMPIDEHEKAKLLLIRSRRLRLCMVVDWIEQLRQSWWFSNGCTAS